MIADNALNDVIFVMDTIHGVDLSIFNESFLQKTIDGRCAVNNIPALPDYADCLANNCMEAQTLQNALYINYSDFFRNSLTYANLEHWLLPKLIEQKADSNELRIWSAGCAYGQEPYSIAMLLETFNEKRSKPIRYRIIATDISEAALAVARKGEYREDSVQNIKMKLVKEFFEKTGEKYKVISRIKEHIAFSSYELMDTSSSFPHESIFGDFDIVLCSNLLFYYKPNHQQFIVDKLVRSLAKDGYLITGEAEKNAANKTGLRMVAPPAAIFQSNEIGGTA